MSVWHFLVYLSSAFRRDFGIIAMQSGARVGKFAIGKALSSLLYCIYNIVYTQGTSVEWL